MSHLLLSPQVLLLRCFHFSSQLQNELISASHLKHRRYTFITCMCGLFLFFFSFSGTFCFSRSYKMERRRTSRCKVCILSRRTAKSASSFLLVWLRLTHCVARSSILALSSSRSLLSFSKALSLSSNWKMVRPHEQRQSFETATHKSNEMLDHYFQSSL